MLRGLRFRIYPNKNQQALFQNNFGCARLVYNKGLAFRISEYEQGRKATYTATNKMLTEMKHCEEFNFLNAVESSSLQQALRDLDKAYVNFFSGEAGFPKFKSKREHYKSFRSQCNNNNIKVTKNHIVLPKVGAVQAKLSREVNGIIKNATVEQMPSGRYFCSLSVEMPDSEKKCGNGMVGIDVGIKEFYTTNEGVSVPNPKHLQKALDNLKKEQRKLSKKTKGSHNFEKQRIKVARIHEHITNQRLDFLHKESLKLVRENQIICVEDLDVKSLLKDNDLALSISDVSWSKFFELLSYKCEEHKAELIKVPTFYPSSQTCNLCGYKNPLVKKLNVRSWSCPVCHTYHEDRDRNAAINILNKGLAMRVAA